MRRTATHYSSQRPCSQSRMYAHTPSPWPATYTNLSDISAAIENGVCPAAQDELDLCRPRCCQISRVRAGFSPLQTNFLPNVPSQRSETQCHIHRHRRNTSSVECVFRFVENHVAERLPAIVTLETKRALVPGPNPDTLSPSPTASLTEARAS